MLYTAVQFFECCLSLEKYLSKVSDGVVAKPPHLCVWCIRDEKTRASGKADSFVLTWHTLPVLVMQPLAWHTTNCLCVSSTQDFSSPPYQGRHRICDCMDFSIQLPLTKRVHDLYGNHTNHIRLVMQKSKGLLVAVSAFWKESKLSFLQHPRLPTLSCLRDARSWDLSNIAYLRDFEIKSPRFRGKTFALSEMLCANAFLCVQYHSYVLAIL